MTIERFAELTEKRDKAVGSPVSSWSEYLEEADYYMRLDKSEWPCGILIADGGDVEHLKQHPDCKPGQDWRE